MTLFFLAGGQGGVLFTLLQGRPILERCRRACYVSSQLEPRRPVIPSSGRLARARLMLLTAIHALPPRVVLPQPAHHHRGRWPCAAPRQRRPWERDAGCALALEYRSLYSPAAAVPAVTASAHQLWFLTFSLSAFIAPHRPVHRRQGRAAHHARVPRHQPHGGVPRPRGARAR